MFYFHALNNLHAYFVLELANTSARWCSGGCTAGLALLCLLGRDLPARSDRWLYGLCFGLLLLPWAVVILFYETQDWADYRSLAPFLWFVIAWLLLHRQKARSHRLLRGLRGGSSMLLLTGDARRRVCGSKPLCPRALLRRICRTLCEAIPYDPDAADPFQNTVRTEIMDIQVMSQLHPGLGVQSGIMYENNTGKSRWILTRFLRISVPGFETVTDNDGGRPVPQDRRAGGIGR